MLSDARQLICDVGSRKRKERGREGTGKGVRESE